MPFAILHREIAGAVKYKFCAVEFAVNEVPTIADNLFYTECDPDYGSECPSPLIHNPPADRKNNESQDKPRWHWHGREFGKCRDSERSGRNDYAADDAGDDVVSVQREECMHSSNDQYTAHPPYIGYTVKGERGNTASRSTYWTNCRTSRRGQYTAILRFDGIERLRSFGAVGYAAGAANPPYGAATTARAATRDTAPPSAATAPAHAPASTRPQRTCWLPRASGRCESCRGSC